MKTKNVKRISVITLCILLLGCVLPVNKVEVESQFFCAHTDSGSKSSVHLMNGVRSVWTEAEKRNLTYKVEGFGANQQMMIDLFTRATLDWEFDSDINFIDKTGTGESTLFIVRPANAAEIAADNGQTSAQAFFPHDDEFEPVIIFFPQFIDYNNSYFTYYTVCHELGHVLGLRHEHIFSAGGNQIDETDYPAELLTQRDTQSVMYYSSKPGYSGSYTISSLDRTGLRSLYGSVVTPTSYPRWVSTKAYDQEKERVSHNGQIWERKWWNQNKEPGNIGYGGPWKYIGIDPAGLGTSTTIPVYTPIPTYTPTPLPVDSNSTTTVDISAWQAGVLYNTGDTASYAGKEYRCLQTHTALVGWEPSNVPSLWTEI